MPDADLGEWIVGMKAVEKPKDIGWINDIPGALVAPDLAGLAWYKSKGKVVGIHREKCFVLYRSLAL